MQLLHHPVGIWLTWLTMAKVETGLNSFLHSLRGDIRDNLEQEDLRAESDLSGRRDRLSEAQTVTASPAA